MQQEIAIVLIVWKINLKILGTWVQLMKMLTPTWEIMTYSYLKYKMTYSLTSQKQYDIDKLPSPISLQSLNTQEGPVIALKVLNIVFFLSRHIPSFSTSSGMIGCASVRLCVHAT